MVEVVTMPKPNPGLLILALLASVAAGAEERRPPVAMPDQLIIGRHTFMDQGPPFDFYELFALRAAQGGTEVERVILTPQANPCFQPATVKRVTAVIDASLAQLLGDKNPCSVPERALRRERDRRKDRPVFSGADVVMQVTCGGQLRRIRVDILDRDLFDPDPRTPEHTSWTMQLLGRLDQATGPGVWDRPIFALPEEPAPRTALDSRLLDEVKRGAFDALFENAPDQPSFVYAQTQKDPPPSPTAELSTDAPLRPLSQVAVKYPPLAIMARIEGRVGLELTVTPEGGVSDLVLTGHPLLKPAVQAAATQWRFPAGAAAGQVFVGTVEFKLNCPSPAR